MSTSFFPHDPLEAFVPLITKEKPPSYPPHNIIHYKETDDRKETFTIQVALAGHARDEIELVVHKDVLRISSVKTTDEREDDDKEYLHRGIATRAFELKFKLGVYCEVGEAKFVDGILHVHITREVPAEEKPKHVTIT